jgi:hypothetical protein
MNLRTPEPLKIEHQELHSDLAAAIGTGGRTADAARNVGRLLHPHFVKEEEYAMPPLGLLADLARGTVEADMSAVLAMTDRLEADLPHMLEEHAAVVAALTELANAANEEGKPDAARFAEKLILHAQTEEQVLYPAAMLVGRYLKLRLGRA